MSRKIFIGAAWPYANGSLHLGHVAGLISGDILARYFRLKGDDVLYVSGSDCHGTPIAVEAEKQGLEPSVIADKYHKEFKHNFLDYLLFTYDNYTQTSTKNHYDLVQEFFLKLHDKGYIYKKTDSLPYCNSCSKFLPDRYIEGTCYICGYDSARGDQCDNCGNLMDTSKLINPTCKTCKDIPVWKDTEHFFLKLSAFQDEIIKYIESSSLWRANAKNFSREFVAKGLHDRAITRDTKWGVPIPVSGYEDKSIYVWFEAVLGYLSASKERDAASWSDFWQNKDAIHYYVHGKDNIPFHSIILPCILMAYGNLHLPDRIVSSEYLNLEGKQLSKSRGHAVWLNDFEKDFEADTLRYYLTLNGPEGSDSNFSWQDFMARINNELIANFGNFVYRVLSFSKKNFPEKLKYSSDIDPKLLAFLDLADNAFIEVSQLIESSQFKKALRTAFNIVEEGNALLNELEPWKKIKTDKDGAEADLAAFCLVIKSLSILLYPFIPQASMKIQASLLVKDLKWEAVLREDVQIGEIEILYKKIEEEVIEKHSSALK